ncbi:MAG: GAF domain-containing protein [Chloroflexi bacterium]|nr:GAF domain-containing protein [Chloroflexota bacterium]
MIDIHPDPLREVRIAKRWAVAGIVLSVAALLPVYGIFLGLSAVDLIFVLAPASVTAAIGIELASRWEYRMRRRYAYPHRLGYELASIHEFPKACAHAARLIASWIKVDAVVVGWLTEDGESLAASGAFGLPEGWIEDDVHIPLGAGSLGESIRMGEIFRRRGVDDPWFGDAFGQNDAIYVPLVSRDRSQGVLAIATAPRNPHVRDKRLLAALGMVAGLALDNCRLYEGQRAHALHLQELNRMKTDFLSTVSHELRTPLTSIMMAADMLREDEEEIDPESARSRLVGSIVKGASRLSSLVADLVNVSRDDEFQPRLELDAAPLSDLVNGAAAIIQPLVAAKRQQLDVQLNSSGVMVLVDRLRFEQVLINLLSNAQRYSPIGGRISVGHETVGGEEVLSVTDSGPGVPDEDRELIFEPFYRGDRSGLGLGLAIAKSIVELHGGRIWVEASPTGGSTFAVALPRQPVSKRPVPASRAFR